LVVSYTIFVEKLLFGQKSSFDPTIAIFAMNLELQFTTCLSLQWYNLQPYIKHYCKQMFQNWPTRVKQIEINFFNPMTRLEFSWSCAQGHRRARAWRGIAPFLFQKRCNKGRVPLS